MASGKHRPSQRTFHFQNPEFIRRQSITQEHLDRQNGQSRRNASNSAINFKEVKKDHHHWDAERHNMEGLERQDKRHSKADLEHLKGILREDRQKRNSLLQNFRTLREEKG